MLSLGENTKVSSLTQDLVRRLLNTSEMLPNYVRISIVDEYTKQILSSGYSFDQTKNIVIAGLKGYESILKRCKEGKTVLHRSAKIGLEERRKKKLLGKGNWFKGKRGRKNSFKPKKKVKKKTTTKSEAAPEIVTVLFVSQTPNGELARRLQKAESEISKLTGERVKIVERGGTQVKQILHKSNPWASGNCNRKKCLPCINGDGKQNCFEKNVVYDISCLSCSSKESPNKPAKYTGQTSLSLHERGKQHLQKLLKKDEASPLYKHVVEVHKGELVDFQMKVVQKHFSAFSRMIHEACRIERLSKSSHIVTMNQKGEIGMCSIPRLTIEKPVEEQEVRKNSFLKQKRTDEVERESKECEDMKKESLEGGPVHNKLGSQSVNLSNSLIKTSPGSAADNNKHSDGCGGTLEVRTRRVYKHVKSNFRFKRKYNDSED